MRELEWRPPRRQDDGAWLQLLLAIEAVDRRGEVLTAEDLTDEWASLWSHPESDAVVAWDGDRPVAFGWIKTQVATLAEHRISLWGGVAPSHRGRGVGTELLARQVARARAVAAGLDPGFPVRLGLEAGAHQHDLLALASGAGFAQERRFLEVARPVDPAPVAVPAPAGLVPLAWDEAVDASVRVAHVEAFADHWGTEPATEESWRQWYTGHRGFRPDLSRVLVEEASGEVAAFCLAAAYPSDWATGPREAWVQSLGTRRGWRGRGAARSVLTATLHEVGRAEDGFERTILGVDAENPTGALALYRSLDFEDVRVTVRLGRKP